MRWRVKEVPFTPPSGIPGEHHTTKATGATEREMRREKWVEEEEKVPSVPVTASVLCRLPQGPVLPRDHCEKEHSSHSRKIYDVNLNKPVQRTAARAGKWTNSHLDTQHTCFNAEYPTYLHRTPLSYPVSCFMTLILGLYVLGDL